MTDPTRVLITGGAGVIGTMLRPRLARADRFIRLLDTKEIATTSPSEESVVASVTDFAAVEEACDGIDTVIHLAGLIGHSSWDEVMAVNIQGTYNVYEAAHRRGVKRVVFASSNHAVGFYPRSKAPAPDYLFPQPDTYYGVGKVTGEALGSMYHDRFGLEVICLRIGSCHYEIPKDVRSLSTWLSLDDAGRLFDACLTVENPGFRVVWGISANTRGWFSLDEARAIGYEPKDDAEKYASDLIAKYGEANMDEIEHSVVGGLLAAPGKLGSRPD